MRVFAIYGSERPAASGAAMPGEAKTYLVAAASEVEACRCVPRSFAVSSVAVLHGVEASTLAPAALAWTPGALQAC
jgi:hypothetical protein